MGGGAFIEADGDIKLGKGYDAARTFLRDNPEIKEKVTDQIKGKIGE